MTPEEIDAAVQNIQTPEMSRTYDISFGLMVIQVFCFLVGRGGGEGRGRMATAKKNSTPIPLQEPLRIPSLVRKEVLMDGLFFAVSLIVDIVTRSCKAFFFLFFPNSVTNSYPNCSWILIGEQSKPTWNSWLENFVLHAWPESIFTRGEKN